MTFELKTLSREAVSRALEKAERYRLLNEPGEAESICLDALKADPGHPGALVILLLALTEQFDAGVPSAIAEAWEVVKRLPDEYDRAYYTGIIYERRAKAHLRHHARGSGHRAYEWLREAMSWFDKAEALSPSGNEDALLRWNACARLIMQDRHLVPAAEEPHEPLFLE